MKTFVSKEKVVCSCSQRLRGQGIFNFAIEYLPKNEKVRKAVFVCSYGAQVESFSKKNGQNLETVSCYYKLVIICSPYQPQSNSQSKYSFWRKDYKNSVQFGN